MDISYDGTAAAKQPSQPCWTTQEPPISGAKVTQDDSTCNVLSVTSSVTFDSPGRHHEPYRDEQHCGYPGQCDDDRSRAAINCRPILSSGSSSQVVRRYPEVVEVATEVQSLQPLAQPQTTSPLGTVGTTSGSVVVVVEPTVTQPVTSATVSVVQMNAVVTMDSGITISAGQTGTIASISPSPVVSVASTAEEPKVISEIVAEVEGPQPHLHQPIAPTVSTTCEANNSNTLEAEPVVTQAATSADTTNLVIAVETPSSTALQDVDASLWDEATVGHKSSPDEKGDSPLQPAAQTDDAEEREIVENIMPKLMSTDDPEALSDTESSSGTDGSKRKAIDREEQSEEGSMGYHGTSLDERKAETEP